MYLLFIFVGFMAIIGLIAFIKTLILSFLSIDEACCSTNLFIKINNSEKSCFDLETEIALSRLRWYNKRKYDNIYVVGLNLSEEKVCFCRDLCHKYDVKLLDFNQFTEIIEKSGTAYG